MITAKKATGVGVFLLLMAAAGFAAGAIGGERPQEVHMAVTPPTAHTNRIPPQAIPPVHTNRLADETSPYLLQHAHNPVDWYTWSEEAFERAKRENKPIFLSIGYSACHWCHVMERESFEDEATAAILNASFISIKVDREERPDVDEIYMTAVQMMTGSGGWPLTVFLTPDLKPFYGGTYFPPDSRYGRPGFKDLLQRIAQLWADSPTEILQSADRLTDAIEAHAAGHPTRAAGLDNAILVKAATQLRGSFDAQWGGFGGAPKFPPSAAISVLLRQYAHTGDEQLLHMATATLDQMACGGLYDQLGGGFHRYSTDEHWLVPHFEKMLYDNALLSRVYLEAWQVTHDDLYRRVAVETMDYVLRDMTDRRGGFHSAEDADSEGQEGAFYIWTRSEIKAVLGEEDGGLFCDYYGVTQSGNFENRNILYVAVDRAEFATNEGMPLTELNQRLARMRGKLRQVRDQRIRPAKDCKVLAAWNGMMISSLARGYQALGEERFLNAAVRAANFVLTEMVHDGMLLRTCSSRGSESDQGESKLPAYLDDYAEMANGLVDLYEASFDLRWLNAAAELADRMIADFWDQTYGGFFYTGDDHRHLLVRTRSTYDGAVPSGNSTAALVLLRLARLLDNDSYYDRVQTIFLTTATEVSAQPRGFLNLLVAADFYLSPVREFAIIGDADSNDTDRLLRVIHDRFIPNRIIALDDPDSPGHVEAMRRIPLLRDQPAVDGKTTVYVCENFACQKPITDAETLAATLTDLQSTRSPAATPQARYLGD